MENEEIKIPKWPMKAVSIREARGSAATANAEGNAIPNISRESASSLKTSLQSQQKKLSISVFIFITSISIHKTMEFGFTYELEVLCKHFSK